MDKTSPEIKFSNIENNGFYNNTVYPRIEISDINLKDSYIKLNGNDYISGSAITGEGIFTITAWAIDKAGNETFKTIAFEIDMNPPLTVIDFNGPHYFYSGINYLNQSTKIILNGSDGSSGIDKTYYYFNTEPYIEYSQPFKPVDLNANLDLVFYSTDNAGNHEEQKTARIFVDTISPVSEFVIYDPIYLNSTGTFISGQTTLEVFAQDSGSGVKRSYYSVNGSSFEITSGLFNLSTYPEGNNTISYYSTDKILNSETSKIKTLILDKTPPEISYSISPYYLENGRVTVYQESVVTLTGTDQGSIPSGMKYLQYRIENSSGFNSGWLNYTEPFDLLSVPIGEYTLTYRGYDNVDNLAEDSVDLNVVPMLETQVSVFQQNSVLVWLNENESILTENQVQNIENIFKELELPFYKLVRTEEDFIDNLRTNAFNIYIILGGQKPLTGHHSNELKEHINSGSGLITCQYDHFMKTGSESPVQGINFLEMFEGNDLIISLENSPVTSQGLLNSLGKSEVIELLEGTDGEAYGLIQAGDQHGPAVVISRYGLGTSVYFPFSLIQSCTDSNKETVKQILDNSIDHVSPENISINPESIISLLIKIKTEPFTLDMRIEEEIPADVSLLFASQGFEVEDDSVSWNIEVDPGDWEELFITVKLPDGDNSYSFITNYYVKVNEIFQLVKTDILDVSVSYSGSEFLSELKISINDLSVDPGEQHLINNAVNFLDKIDLTDSERQEQNITYCLHAIDSINKVTTADITEVRLELDDLLKILQTQ